MRKIFLFVLSVLACTLCLCNVAEGQQPKVFCYPFFIEKDSNAFKMYSLEQLVERELGFPEGYCDTVPVVINIPYTIDVGGMVSYIIMGEAPEPLMDQVLRIMSSVPDVCYPAMDRSLQRMEYSDTLRILFRYPRYDAAQYGIRFSVNDYYDGPGGRVWVHTKPEFRSTREISGWQKVLDGVKLPQKTPQTDSWLAYTVKSDCSMADLTYDPALPENIREEITGVLEGKDLWGSPAMDWFENPSDFRDTLYFSTTKKQTVKFSPVGGDAVMPSFEGEDLMRFREWVMGQIRYPADMAKQGVTGNVVFSFAIEKDGELSCLTVVSAPHISFVGEVLYVLSKSPGWKPGTFAGEPVRVKYTLPVQFKIQN